MLRMLSVMRRKSPRVADENMLSAVNGAHHHQNIPIFVHDLNNRRRRRRRRGSSSGPGWNAFSLIYGVARVPLSIISCFSQPHVNGADGVWVSGEFAQISEMNHLMIQMKEEAEKIALNEVVEFRSIFSATQESQRIAE